jgi:hypothetical protein
MNSAAVPESCDTEKIGRGGRDLSNYSDELIVLRKSRTLNLRRSINLCHNRTCNCNGKFYVSPKRSNALSTGSEELSIEYIVQTLDVSTSGQSKQGAISMLCGTIVEAAEKSVKIITQIMQSAAVQEAFVNYLEEGPQQSTCDVLNALSVVFKFAGQTMEDFIDIGLSSQLMFLLSEENEEILASTINLIGEISNQSTYARDAVICLGMHTMLIELASKVRGNPLACTICEALHSIFANPSPIDSEIIRDSVEPIFRLLEGQTEDTINSIIAVLVVMSSKQPSIVFALSNLGLYDIICDLVTNPKLTQEALRLLCNLCVAQPPQIKILLDHGLLDILMGLSSTPYAGDVFWVLSNLLESMPEVVFSTFENGLLEAALTAAEDAPFEIKREAAFLISTIIVYGGNEKIEEFFIDRVFCVISDILGCGVPNVVIRCFDALVSFLSYAQTSGKMKELIQLFTDNDIEDRLRDLDEKKTIIGQRARSILIQISRMH